MNKTKSTLSFLFLVISIMFIIVVIIFVQNIRCKGVLKANQNDLYKLQKIVSNENGKMKSLTDGTKLTHESNGLVINTNTAIKTENNTSVLLEQLVGTTPKLVFRYSEINCQTCVSSEISLLKELAGEFSDKNILIFSSYDSFRNLGVFKRTNQISMKIFNIENIGIPLEEINVPYYFVIDSNMVLRDVMIPNKYFPQNSKSYLKYIKRRYFE